MRNLSSISSEGVTSSVPVVGASEVTLRDNAGFTSPPVDNGNPTMGDGPIPWGAGLNYFS